MRPLRTTRCALRPAFTIVELTGVIGIICVLAAILFPVFAQARSRARQSRCGSSLCQLGMALQMYARDNDGKLPPEHHKLAPLAAYVRDDAVFRCPEDPLRDRLPAPEFTSYCYRGGLTLDDRPDIPVAGDAEFRHSSGAYELMLSGAVKWHDLRTWVPVAPGRRRLPPGLTAPDVPAVPYLDRALRKIVVPPNPQSPRELPYPKAMMEDE